MISEKMAKALNDQIALEGKASFLYLSMSSWCDQAGLEGCANFMRRQSEEEHEHMIRIFDYLSEVNQHALAPAIPQVPHSFESVQSLMKEVFAHEQKVTASINNLIHLANEENDYTTLNFLQWYVVEQREEEALMRTVLDKIELIGDGPMTLYYIDKEIAAINAQQLKAEQEETE